MQGSLGDHEAQRRLAAASTSLLLLLPLAVSTYPDATVDRNSYFVQELPLMSPTCERNDDGSVVSLCFARIGLLGNPSDGYGGSVIGFSLANFAAEVL